MQLIINVAVYLFSTAAFADLLSLDPKGQQVENARSRHRRSDELVVLKKMIDET
mgnify:FL=1